MSTEPRRRYRDSAEEAATRSRESPIALRDLPLDQPILLADLACAMRMRTQRLRRRLFKIHRKQDDPVLVQIGQRWAVTSINRLRQVWHGLGERGLTVEELTEQLAECRARESLAQERNRELKRELGSLRARQRATEERVVELEHAFVKATRLVEHFTTTELERPTPGAFAGDENESGTHLVEGARAPGAKRIG